MTDEEKYARELWISFVRSGRKPDDIPDRPDLVYHNKGWKGWCDWIGNPDEPWSYWLAKYRSQTNRRFVS